MINRIIELCAKNRFLVFLFAGVAVLFGWHSLNNTKLDAIPDLSDTQVIVYAKWDRSPDIMEDQVSYPVTSALLGMPKVCRTSVALSLRVSGGAERGVSAPHARRVPQTRTV